MVEGAAEGKQIVKIKLRGEKKGKGKRRILHKTQLYGLLKMNLKVLEGGGCCLIEKHNIYLWYILSSSLYSYLSVTFSLSDRSSVLLGLRGGANAFPL